MGRLPVDRLPAPRVYACANCGAHLSSTSAVSSRSFTGRAGRAYLFSSVANATHGPREERALMTGQHTVADAFCAVCAAPLGWMYLAAADPSQRYKVGQYVLERRALRRAAGRWVRQDGDDDGEGEEVEGGEEGEATEEGAESDDE